MGVSWGWGTTGVLPFGLGASEQVVACAALAKATGCYWSEVVDGVMYAIEPTGVVPVAGQVAVDMLAIWTGEQRRGSARFDQVSDEWYGLALPEFEGRPLQISGTGSGFDGQTVCSFQFMLRQAQFGWELAMERGDVEAAQINGQLIQQLERANECGFGFSMNF